MDQWSKEIKLQKLLKENTGVNFHDLRFSNGLSDVTPKSRATEEKNKLDKISNFCASKEFYQESKKTSYRMKENICMPYLW